MYAEFVKEFDSADSIANNLLGAYFDGYDLFSYADVLASVSFEDVSALFDTQFCEEQITLSVILPS